MIPLKLYQYQPPRPEAFANLVEHKIWFKRISELNDPFDCAIKLGISSIPSEDFERSFMRDRQRVLDKDAFDHEYLTDAKPNEVFRRKTIEGAQDAFEIYRRTLLHERGIACFSEVKPEDDLLMWSHYAWGHTGFCLEFDTSFYPFSPSDYLHKVCYQNEIPSVNPIRVQFLEEDALTPMITVKAKCWEYEKEWRILHKKGGHVREEYDPKCLTAVYLGTAMTVTHKAQVSQIRGTSPAQVYQMRKSDTELRLISDLVPSSD